ncbi:putative Squamosa promoter-binding-like protein 9 [Cocos nucifera]|nr:putative Squamosa promoter-binding-like protein 9 [Cocos nucifera]
MIIHVLKDGTSLTNIKMEVQAPRLHYVYPTYFEAGKPMEFVACGSNLNQPKFRFLVSFAGKYLSFNSCSVISHGKTKYYDKNRVECLHNSDHEMFRINITQTNMDVFGPAFIEVENVSGISNFVPILIGNKNVCSEMKRIQDALGEPYCADSISSQNAVSGASPALCEFFVSRQNAISELLLDIAWLLKEPHIDDRESLFSLENIQRLTSLLKFLIQNRFVSIIEVVLNYWDNIVDGKGFDKSENWYSDADMRLLYEYVNHAKEILCYRTLHDVESELDSKNTIDGNEVLQSYLKSDVVYTMPCTNQDRGARNEDGPCSATSTATQEDDVNLPLVTNRIIHRRSCYPHLGSQWHHQSWGDIIPTNIMRRRLGVILMVGVVTCFAACIVLFHPHKAREFAVLRRCLFGGPMQ